MTLIHIYIYLSNYLLTKVEVLFRLTKKVIMFKISNIATGLENICPYI